MGLELMIKGYVMVGVSPGARIRARIRARMGASAGSHVGRRLGLGNAHMTAHA